jgi:murein hydrolase activator
VRRALLPGILLAMMPTAAAQAGEAPVKQTPAPPVSAPGAQAHFEALVTEIGDLRSELDKIDRRERGILHDIDKLDLEATLHARELERLAMLRERARADLDESRPRLESIRREAGESERALAGQLREVYKAGMQGDLRLMLAVTDPVDLLRGLAYLDALARRRTERVSALRRSRSEMEAMERSLEAQAESLADLQKQTEAKAGQLEQVRHSASDLLRATREDGEAHRSAIAELTRAAEELEAAIVEGQAQEGSSGPTGVPAIDVARLRGALPWPAPGRLSVPFGDVRHPRFGTVTPHPGVDIETEPGAPIRAVLAGRVLFSRRFSGYGNTVLLDHGGRYLSVYARAASLSVGEGEDVVTGQVLGASPERGLGGGPPIIYFEFRQDGKAVDPALWLKRNASSAKEQGS